MLLQVPNDLSENLWRNHYGRPDLTAAEAPRGAPLPTTASSCDHPYLHMTSLSKPRLVTSLLGSYT